MEQIYNVKYDTYGWSESYSMVARSFPTCNVFWLGDEADKEAKTYYNH